MGGACERVGVGSKEKMIIVITCVTEAVSVVLVLAAGFVSAAASYDTWHHQ